jgi:flagellar basal body-associated protein FliL
MKTKNIIKEIIIVLLLILAIILILGILLYEYVPNNKIIPQQVSYTTPENVKEELSTSENVDDSQVIMTYEVTATDLTNYKKTKDYVSGKKNPFESIESQNTTTENTTSGNTVNSGTTGNSSTTNTNTTTDNTQQGYLPDKGTK